MPACNITRTIPSNECIGDSLRTINSNFSALDINFCNLPSIREGLNVDIETNIDETKRIYNQINIETSPTFYNKFHYTTNTAFVTSIRLEDSTSLQAYEFPYISGATQTKPIGTFETICQFEGKPELSLFWLADSSNLGTIFALNSSTNFANQSEVSPDGEVLTFYKDENTLYIGGSFKSVGSVSSPYIAAINLNSGQEHPTLGYVGAKTMLTLSAVMSDVTQGYVCCLDKFTFNNSQYLIVGGSFNSQNLGRSFFIYNLTTQQINPFYFNGKVNDIKVHNGNIYVVGQFDYLNKGTLPASLSERIQCKSFVKININNNFSIDSLFTSNATQSIQVVVEFFALAIHNNYFYVGGNFQNLNLESNFSQKNLAAIDFNGNIISEWRFIFNKPIYTLLVDGNALYVGGDFTSAHSYDDLYIDSPFLNNISKNNFFHAAALDLRNFAAPVLNYTWKPKFNDAVYKLEVQNSSSDSYLYASGKFSSVNNVAADYIASLTKAVDMLGENSSGQLIPWNCYLEFAPSRNTNALLVNDDFSLFVGGNFNLINGQKRLFFAKVSNPLEFVSQPKPFLSIDCGVQPLGSGQSILLNFEEAYTSRVVTTSGPKTSINKTVISFSNTNLRYLTKNQLCRFFIRRPGNSNAIGSLLATDDTFQKSIFIVGWSLDFKND